VWAVGSVPNSDSKYIIIAAAPSSGGGGGPSAATIAAAVWDEAVAAHLTAGTTGLKLSETGSVANTASAVWDELTAGHDGFGSFGRPFNCRTVAVPRAVRRRRSRCVSVFRLSTTSTKTG